MTRYSLIAAGLFVLGGPAAAQGLDPQLEIAVACAMTMNQDDTTCWCLADRAAEMLSEDAQFYMAAGMMRHTRLAESLSDRVTPEDQIVIQRLLAEAGGACDVPSASGS